jgi:DnaJ-class molecular chaperone
METLTGIISIEEMKVVHSFISKQKVLKVVGEGYVENESVQVSVHLLLPLDLSGKISIGNKVSISLSTLERCHQCGGKGKVTKMVPTFQNVSEGIEVERKCESCGGSGIKADN